MELEDLVGFEREIDGGDVGEEHRGHCRHGSMFENGVGFTFKLIIPSGNFISNSFSFLSFFFFFFLVLFFS